MTSLKVHGRKVVGRKVVGRIVDMQTKRGREKGEREREREDTSDVFTKVNRGGFREIRTGVGRVVKTRTDARGME